MVKSAGEEMAGTKPVRGFPMVVPRLRATTSSLIDGAPRVPLR